MTHSFGRPRDEGVVSYSARSRWARRSAAAMLAVGGVLFVTLATAWRGLEAIVSGHAIQLVTGETTIAVPAHHLLILHKGPSAQAIFVLTSECTVAYLLAALFIGGAPLMLLRRLSPRRTAIAIIVTATILTLVNVIRLTAIGAAVSQWGIDRGFSIAHTYVGSVLTIVGTSVAAIVFGAVLIGRRKTHRPAVG